MNPLHIVTPHFHSQPLSLSTGKDIWLKFESMQPSGSFKLRGIGHACQNAVRNGAKRFISSSGGNAGIAAAYAGRKLSIPVLVVVPETTSERAKEMILEQNAEVVVHGESWQEANQLAVSRTGELDFFIHPFDNPLLWQGHASMIDEIASTGEKPDVVVLSVGGGGLLCGVVEGLQRNDWSDVPVIAVETEGANSLERSIREGRLIELAAIQSIATSLGARKVCEQAYLYSSTYPITSMVVSDKSAVNACNQFIEDHRVVIEPACGASLSVIYENSSTFDDFRSILIIVCGGATATVAQLKKWTEIFV